MKRFLLSLISICLSLTASAGAVEIDGIYYNLIPKAKIAEVTSNPNKYSGIINIPETVTYNNVECKVTTIGNKAFSSCYNLTSITIPHSVTTIGESAFYECSGLTTVSIPDSVTSIGYRAFYDCYRLASVTIGNSVTSIVNSTFMLCRALTSVTIGNSVTSIGYNAFCCCERLTSITIPNSVTSIGESAFRYCSALTSVTIGNNVTSIGYCAFEGCNALTSVHISDLVAWCNISFETFSNPLKYAHHLYLNGSEIKDLMIPNSVTSISNNAFSGCSGLNSVTIPNSVKNIGNGAFSDCNGLTSVTIPNSVKNIGNSAFSDCNGLTSVTIPNSVTSIGWAAFANCPEIIDVTCLARLVPDTQSNAFENSLINYATLHVPSASVNAYKNIEPWKNFKEIVKLDIPKHKLIYIVDDDIYKTIEFEEGEFITPEPVPTKEGYTFSGWSEIPETMPAHDVTVTGTFTINKYKMTYMVDGEEYKSYEIEYGATITPEADPEKEGHTFSGWSEIPETMPAHDVTVTGTFTINRYKLTYMVDGEEYKSYEIKYGATITPEADPEKEGYTFSGWSEIPETMPAHDVTVTGSFSINSYKLTYMIDDKIYKETMYEYGATITPEPQPEGDYASFEWTDLPEKMPAHDVVVHASYTTEIIEVLMATQRNVRIYTPNGKKLNKLQKGLNIVVLNDGTVKKVVVK